MSTVHMNYSNHLKSVPEVGRKLIPQALDSKHIPSHCTTIIQIINP